MSEFQPPGILDLSGYRGRFAPSPTGEPHCKAGTYSMSRARSATSCSSARTAVGLVVDDALQGVTDVVRGDDLLDSTPR